MRPRTVFYRVPFDDHWTRLTHSILEVEVAQSGLTPLVLLPDDI